MVTSVAKNMEAFQKREVRGATEARRLMATIGRPSERHTREIVAKRQIPNCSVTEQDVHNSLIILRPDVTSLKGKTNHRSDP